MDYTRGTAFADSGLRCCFMRWHAISAFRAFGYANTHTCHTRRFGTLFSSLHLPEFYCTATTALRTHTWNRLVYCASSVATHDSCASGGELALPLNVLRFLRFICRINRFAWDRSISGCVHMGPLCCGAFFPRSRSLLYQNATNTPALASLF